MLSLFHEGSWLGEVELFSNMGRMTTLTAIRPTRYLHLSSASIEEIARENSEIWRALGHLAAEHVALAVSGLDDLTIRSSFTRLVAVLLRLSGARLEILSGPVAAKLDVTQAELAQLTNLSRSVVGEILVEMEQRKLIQRKYGQLNLLDIGSLRSFLKNEDEPTSDTTGEIG
jgi:CRP-like cAMP-binding protein